MHDGARFSVPYALTDFIQSTLFLSKNYYEIDILKDLDRFLPDTGVFVDAGANIGNHTIYWALHGAKRTIHAFEPVESTFKMLTKNARLNELEDQVVNHQCALGERSGRAKISKFDLMNIGGTQIKGDESGEIQVETLDSVTIAFPRLDFLKIDTEGFELKVLRGGEQTILKHKPLIFVETFEQNRNEVFSYLADLGYKLLKEYPDDNYLFQSQNN